MLTLYLISILISSCISLQLSRKTSLGRQNKPSSVGTCAMTDDGKDDDEVYWNQDLGIWQDTTGKACVKVLADLKEEEPLFVFGYGSLIWKPGELLERYPSYVVDAIAYQRLFAQRSYDHRGTPRFPGLVLTVHPVNHENQTSSSICSGRVFLVPEKDRQQVLEELDFREKGGYTRTVMEVRMRGGQDGPYAEGDIFRAIVYYAECSNPLFFDAAADLSSRGIHATANLIAAAEGPSGHNAAYLLELSHYLYFKNPSLTDRYLISLCQSVYSRSCLWSVHSRGLFELAKHCIDDPLSLLGENIHSNTMTEEADGCGKSRFVCLGWGSNEYSQLQLDPDNTLLSLPIAKPIDFATFPDLLDPQGILLVAGGGSSGYVNNREKCMRVWGQMGKYSLSRVHAACLGHSHGLALHDSGKLVSFGDDSHGQCSRGPSFLCQQLSKNKDIDDLDFTAHGEEVDITITKAACGLRHSAAVDSRGRLHIWGSTKHGQILTQGAEKHVMDAGVVPPSLPFQEGVSLEPRFIDVACGARHTVALDNRGEVWGCGDNRHGSLGNVEFDRAGGCGLGRICDLPMDVKWTSVKSGWSHVVAKGVKQDGSVTFFCWGRCDLQQLPHESNCPSLMQDGKYLAPCPLLELPRKKSGDTRTILEVWCGAEHTVAADEEGFLWVTGWSDHSGEPREGDNADLEGHWTPVLQLGSHARTVVTHGTVMESHVAAGGAHTIFLGR